MGYQKKLCIALGWLFFAIGVIGAFVPIMPTTPFLIVAAFFFSKGSVKLHQWLLTRPYFGSALGEWEKHKVIRLQAKVTATLMLIGGMSVSAYFTRLKPFHLVILGTILFFTLLFIWTRRSLPPKE